MLRRNTVVAPDLYYESLLNTLKERKSAHGSWNALFWEQGEALAEGESDRDSLFLLSDINGLLFQPFCRTLDESGGVRFVDAAELFDPGRIQKAKQALEKGGFHVRIVPGAAVAAPRLLSSAEKAVLREWGAGVAVRHLYLEARAARAGGATALGIAAARSLDISSCLKALAILSTLE
jgi:hypothetical protein